MSVFQHGCSNPVRDSLPTKNLHNWDLNSDHLKKMNMRPLFHLIYLAIFTQHAKQASQFHC